MNYFPVVCPLSFVQSNPHNCSSSMWPQCVDMRFLALVCPRCQCSHRRCLNCRYSCSGISSSEPLDGRVRLSHRLLRSVGHPRLFPARPRVAWYSFLVLITRSHLELWSASQRFASSARHRVTAYHRFPVLTTRFRLALWLASRLPHLALSSRALVCISASPAPPSGCSTAHLQTRSIDRNPSRVFV